MSYTPPELADAPLSRAFLEDFVERWNAAWDSHETDQVLALLASDIVWEDTVFWPEVIEGIEGTRAYVDAIFAVMPDVEFDSVQFFTAPEAGRALWLFRQRGSSPARFGNKPFSTYGCDIFLGFKNGKLSRYLAQYEISDMMRQFDALPPRAGRIGGAYLLSLLGSSAK